MKETIQHNNLAVFRFGTRYTIDVKQNWALVPKVHLDFKESNNTWYFAVSFARKL